jgi:hypothetical protein
MNLFEGVKFKNGEYLFNFKSDDPDDIVKLKFNKKPITKKQTRGLISYYSYRVNKQVDKNFVKKFKTDLTKTEDYTKLLKKAVMGLFNNNSVNFRDIDLILTPQSSSPLNRDLASLIKAKIPNAVLSTTTIVKSLPSEIQLDYDLIEQKKLKPETVRRLETVIKVMNQNNFFQLKKITPRFRKFFISILKLNDSDRRVINLLDEGKILIVDDYISEGTTFKEAQKLLSNFTNTVIYYTLFK